MLFVRRMAQLPCKGCYEVCLYIASGGRPLLHLVGCDLVAQDALLQKGAGARI